jgi:uncharacterized caspase-like protein
MVPHLLLPRWRLKAAMLLILVVLCGLASRPAVAEPRIALVVGNGAYEKVNRLPNAVSDAKLIAKALAELGFKVTEVTDANQAAMKTAIAEFGRALRAGGPDSVGLFYYAGHGVQASGVNYLLPTEIAIRDNADLDLLGVEANWVVRQMESARNVTNIIILDACRSNPFSNLPTAERGLARMDAPTGTFIAFSTAPGAIAMDGKGANSPFSAALAAALATPAQPIEEVFKQVRVSVLRDTGGQQTPWDSSSLVRNFVFNAAPLQAATAEQRAWAAASGSSDPTQLLKFLQDYPHSLHTDEAQALLKAVNGRPSANRTTNPPTPTAAAIRYTTPLKVGTPELDGKSIEQLVQGAPAYPPIDGLPDAAWRGRPCATCHDKAWTKKSLCEQGNFYVKAGDARMLSVNHPFGHAFSASLRSWAVAGCP